MERLIAQIDAVGGEEIESDECGGRLFGELLHARSRRMQPHLQRVEVEAARRRDDDLAVEDTAGGQLRVEDVVQLGKVAIERPQVAALDVDVVRAAKHERAKAIPLRLEEEARRPPEHCPPPSPASARSEGGDTQPGQSLLSVPDSG